MKRKPEKVAGGTPPGICSAMNIKTDYSQLLAGLQALSDTALHFALLYRFDPILGGLHNDYFNAINAIIQKVEK